MKQLLFMTTCLLVVNGLMAQTPQADTTRTLQSVTVKAFEQNRQLKEVSGAINYIGKTQLERFNNSSLLPALNTTPGVHMEERSPGSYRLNVRGSTLRSPFGVRNIKIYWNGLPFTDPGGNTYLNLLSYYNVNSMEVIKGPSGSLYGAGTGGAVLINSQPETFVPGAEVSYIYGSFNQHNINAQVRLGNDDRRNAFGFSHMETNGYRNHTNMDRKVFTWETQLKVNDKQQIQASILYGDFWYQTPGGLTKAEYTANPRAARPNADVLQAAINTKNFLAGITHTYRFSDHVTNTSSFYAAYSQIFNPTFRNYEKRMEPHLGGRTVFNWNTALQATKLNLSWGFEIQRGFFNTKTFLNKKGLPDSTQTDDDLNAITSLAFAQASFRFPGDWNLDAGASLNRLSVNIYRVVPSAVYVKKIYHNGLAPRLAISKKIIPELLLYASIAKGFSPPTTQEILPSTSVISTGLKAEEGVNYEAGIKSSWLQQRLYVEVNAFYYRLQNAIVQRRDASNADYFVNAGSTKQQGLESQAWYQLLPQRKGFVTSARLWISHTWSDFHYRDFKQISNVTNDYSGKQLPSVAPHIVTAGLDLAIKPGIYTNITWYYSDPIALNDANTDIASSYQLLGGRLGWRQKWGKHVISDLFGGVDNAFNTTYSLGNDINAAAGRYYNPAAGINYYGGITLKYVRGQ